MLVRFSCITLLAALFSTACCGDETPYLKYSRIDTDIGPKVTSDLGQFEQMMHDYSKEPLSFVRFYDSGCTHVGDFGRGWSTQWEAKLGWFNGELGYQSTACGDVVLYNLFQDSAASLEAQHIDPKSIQSLLKSQPWQSSVPKLVFLPKYHGQQTDLNAPDEIDLLPTGFVTPNPLSAVPFVTFDPDGVLKSRIGFSINYSSNGKILSITNMLAGVGFAFERLNGELTVRSLAKPEDYAEYKISANNDLQQVEAGGSNPLKKTYLYDQMHRLITTFSADGELNLVFYNENGATVAYESDQNTCVTSYSQRRWSDDYVEVDVSKQCDGKVVNHESKTIHQWKDPDNPVAPNVVVKISNLMSPQ